MFYIHLDFRSFFATCGQFLNPELRGRQVVVYNESFLGKRKIIASSREAKERGIDRDTPINRIERNHEIVFIKNRFEYYQTLSERLYTTCKKFAYGFEVSKPHIDDLVLKIDAGLGTALTIAEVIKNRFRELGFDSAIGISKNQDYADMASKLSKKYGLIYFGGEFAKKFFYKWPVIKFPNIGPKREKMLNDAGIYTIGDILESSLDFISGILGEKTGRRIYLSVLSEDNKQAELFSR